MKKPVILCVDDENIVLNSLKTELRDAFDGEYLIEIAENGYDAIEIIEELSDDNYELPLVIADYIMPDMKGDELLMKVHEISPKTLKVLLTGQASIEGVTNAVNNANLYRYISKPWEKNDLAMTVTEAVRSYFQDKQLEEQNRQLREINITLERKVEERTRELEQKNKNIMDSIQYAEKIQRSLLPNQEEAKKYLPDSFVIWMPRDIVGGDIFHADSFGDGFVIAVMDCTGHGVPGAFMTMIASSFIRRITRTFKCHDPAEILKQLNSIVKTSLQQDKEDTLSDDGMDAAVCFVKPDKKLLTFAGAKIPLIYIRNDQMTVIKGDRRSIGYKRSDTDFSFTSHTVSIEKGMSFYMYSDGFVDQIGEDGKSRFGTRRFKELLKKIAEKPFDRQREILVKAFEEHRGGYERQDDVTVLGFGF